MNHFWFLRTEFYHQDRAASNESWCYIPKLIFSNSIFLFVSSFYSILFRRCSTCNHKGLYLLKPIFIDTYNHYFPTCLCTQGRGDAPSSISFSDKVYILACKADITRGTEQKMPSERSTILLLHQNPSVDLLIQPKGTPCIQNFNQTNHVYHNYEIHHTSTT